MQWSCLRVFFPASVSFGQLSLLLCVCFLILPLEHFLLMVRPNKGLFFVDEIAALHLLLGPTPYAP